MVSANTRRIELKTGENGYFWLFLALFKYFSINAKSRRRTSPQKVQLGILLLLEPGVKPVGAILVHGKNELIVRKVVRTTNLEIS